MSSRRDDGTAAATAAAGEPPAAQPARAPPAALGSCCAGSRPWSIALVAVVRARDRDLLAVPDSYNIFTLCTNIGDLAIMALPMTLIIITGEIDLSVASILALSAELLGTCGCTTGRWR